MSYRRMLHQVARLGLVGFPLAGCTAMNAEPTATPTSIPLTPTPTPMALSRLDGQQALFVAYVHFEPDLALMASSSPPMVPTHRMRLM